MRSPWYLDHTINRDQHVDASISNTEGVKASHNLFTCVKYNTKRCFISASGVSKFIYFPLLQKSDLSAKPACRWIGLAWPQWFFTAEWILASELFVILSCGACRIFWLNYVILSCGAFRIFWSNNGTLSRISTKNFAICDVNVCPRAFWQLYISPLFRQHRRLRKILLKCSEVKIGYVLFYLFTYACA